MELDPTSLMASAWSISNSVGYFSIYFIAGVMHIITGVDSTYNFTTHCYVGIDASWGVAFKFTPSTTGTYYIVVADPSSTSYKYVYYYGTDASFGSYTGYQSGTGTVTYSISATTGATYYFKIQASSSS